LHRAINCDSLFDIFAGQMAVLLGESAAVNAFNGSWMG